MELLAMGLTLLLSHLKENWKAYTIGLIILAALTVAGQYANQYRSLKTASEELARTSAVNRAELERKVEEAHEQLKQSHSEASTYKRRWAQLQADGKVALDGQGNPVYNEEDTTRDVSDLLEQEAIKHAEETKQLNEYIATMEKEKVELLQRVTKPTSAGWGPAIGVDAPAWSDMSVLRGWYGADFDLALGGWRMNCSALIAPPADLPVFENLQAWGGRLQISLH